MVQVRCPECGYLQSLSEERFLSISEDFLNCPHCHARVPKQWGPCNADNVPDEARHKMSAFAGRILNGGVVAKEVAHALESLIRRYGPFESCYKALGIGYTKLGDFKKAEEFLSLSLEHDGFDGEVDKYLLETLIGLERYHEAKAVGLKLLKNAEASGDDVARTALALFNLEETEQANELLKSYPIIDTTSPAAKQLKRQLAKASGANFGAKLKQKVNLKRFLGDSGKDSLKSLTERAINLFSSNPVSSSEADGHEKDEPITGTFSSVDERKADSSREISPKVEYWIYSPQSEIPKWDDVKRSFGQAISSPQARARAYKLLESLIASNDLNIEYILRSEAEELFDYPEELIRLNSRNFTDEDFQSFSNSQMIVRLELTPTSSWGVESLRLIVSFVEGLRNLTDGIVQDAVSHTLWGLESWLEFTKKPVNEIFEDHLHIEALDEDGSIWMHTHGMLKFGLPDVELEGIPENFKKQGRELLVMAASDLVERKVLNKRLNGELWLFDGAIAANYTLRPADDEGHFPDGVFSLSVFVSSDDPDRPESLIDALRLVESGARVRDRIPVLQEGAMNRARWGAPTPIVDDTRNRIIAAHRKARERLEDFRRSFEDYSDDERQVHAVKVGFPAADGKREWMWVSLADWNEGSLSGRLENTPVVRTDLYKGCPVEVDESDIFDWVISSDGKVLNGAFTEAIDQ